MKYFLLNFRTHKKEFFLFQKEEVFSISPIRKDLLLDNENVMVVGFALRMYIKFKTCHVGFFMVNNELILSIENTHWRVTENKISVRFARNKYPGINCFQLLEENKTIFQHYYLNHYISQPLNWIDIMYSPEEDELDDFFLWIGSVCNDKKSIVWGKEMWIKRLNE